MVFKMFHHRLNQNHIYLGITLLVFLAGCAQQHEVSFKSGGMTHTIAQGSAAIPKEFENLIYTDAVPNGSISSEGSNDEQSKFMALSSSDSLTNVSKWYQEQLKVQNWPVDGVQDMPKLVSINAHKDALELNIMIAEDGPKTTISMNMG